MEKIKSPERAKSACFYCAPCGAWTARNPFQGRRAAALAPGYSSSPRWGSLGKRRNIACSVLGSRYSDARMLVFRPAPVNFSKGLLYTARTRSGLGTTSVIKTSTIHWQAAGLAFATATNRRGVHRGQSDQERFRENRRGGRGHDGLELFQHHRRKRPRKSRIHRFGKSRRPDSGRIPRAQGLRNRRGLRHLSTVHGFRVEEDRLESEAAQGLSQADR